MSSNLDRINIARKIIQGKRKSTDEQRDERRQRLIERFKSVRIHALDSLRNLKVEKLTYGALCELKKQILSTLDDDVLIKESDLSDILDDLDEEINLLQCEEYEKLCEEEVDLITRNFMNNCDFCDKLTLQSHICESCTQKHFDVI